MSGFVEAAHSSSQSLKVFTLRSEVRILDDALSIPKCLSFNFRKGKGELCRKLEKILTRDLQQVQGVPSKLDLT